MNVWESRVFSLVTDWQFELIQFSQQLSQPPAPSKLIKPRLFPSVWDHVTDAGTSSRCAPQIWRNYSNHLQASEFVCLDALGTKPAPLLLSACDEPVFPDPSENLKPPCDRANCGGPRFRRTQLENCAYIMHGESAFSFPRARGRHAGSAETRKRILSCNFRIRLGAEIYFRDTDGPLMGKKNGFSVRLGA